MVRLIMGVKGSGKTKQLIELINNAAKDEPGNVVCIEANRNLTYDIHYHIRLIDAQEYKLNSYDMFRGFISGLYAGNYDISHVFIDSLCRAIGRRCGKACRMALSFEMTFLSMLLTSLYEPQTNGEMRRCAFHPIEKRLMLGNDAIDYCADLSALISYYDLRDGWEDERRVDRLAESALLKAAAGRAGGALPRQREAVERYVARLHEVERRNDMNLDAAANLSGEMLGELYVWKKDVYERDLRELGFYLGKFIYLCDSFEDVEQDIKKKNYNPLVERFERPEFEAESRMMLEDMMARACRAFECLPLLEDAPIMRNILYSGIWLRFEGACERRKAKSKQ